jgi:predicted metalloprotease with PDZ domain
MKNNLIYLLLLMLFADCRTAKKGLPSVSTLNSDNNYRYEIDLVNVKDDKVAVTLFPPKTALSKGKFVIPKLVPGYYGAMDFGQHISDFKAVDKAGNSLKTTKLDKNSWLVDDLQSVQAINYSVDDGWDDAILAQKVQNRRVVCSYKTAFLLLITTH